MQALYNHTGELIAYQYQHMLLHPGNLTVLGLVIGDCVFGSQARVLGKVFQRKVYNMSGEVLARREEKPLLLPEKFDIKSSITQAWRILMKIRDHACPWVDTKEKWSQASLDELLYID
jgi:hypothetical protein